MGKGDRSVPENHKKLRLAVVDIGTQSLRTSIFTGDGELVEMAKLAYDQPYHSPQEGFAEKDPNDYWEYLKEGFRELRNRGINLQDVSAVCITCQRATTVFLGERMQPTRPAILWLDRRKAQNAPSIGLLEILVRPTPLWKHIKEVQRRAPINWVKENQPHIWQKTKKVCLLSAYINYKLTENYADSTACQVGYLPFNFKRQRWESNGHWKYRLFPVHQSMLPELKPPTATLGFITQRASRETGLKERTPVIAGASDKACEVIGAGCTKPWQGCLSYGTTATINVNHTKYIEPLFLQPAYPSAIPSEYNLEFQVSRGFWLVTWFKELASSNERDLEKEAAKIAPGSEGLVFQPYWESGVRYPGPHSAGCIVGLRDHHKRSHIYRALIEGLIFALREGKEFIEKKTKIPIKELYITGGGSISDLVAQCTADIMGIPVKRPRYFEASSLGAAILATTGLGVYPNIRNAITRVCHIKETFHPIKENQLIYNHIYHNAFKNLLKQLRPIYKRLYIRSGGGSFPEIPVKRAIP